jgi:hypothetical protein
MVSTFEILETRTVHSVAQDPGVLDHGTIWLRSEPRDDQVWISLPWAHLSGLEDEDPVAWQNLPGCA